MYIIFLLVWIDSSIRVPLGGNESGWLVSSSQVIALSMISSHAKCRTIDAKSTANSVFPVKNYINKRAKNLKLWGISNIESYK